MYFLRGTARSAEVANGLHSCVLVCNTWHQGAGVPAHVGHATPGSAAAAVTQLGAAAPPSFNQGVGAQQARAAEHVVDWSP